MTTTQRITLGTVSHGTMRNEDLIPAFAYELAQIDTEGAYTSLVTESHGIEDFDSEQADFVLEDLFDALDALAPPYCYFGANEGDGADYGFWPSIDSLQDACWDGGCRKVYGLADIPADYRGEVMIVNAHGEVTFGHVNSDGRFVTVWGCV